MTGSDINVVGHVCAVLCMPAMWENLYMMPCDQISHVVF